MEQRRVAALVTVVGGVGLVIGRLVFVLARPGGSGFADFWSVWTAMVLASLGLSLLLLALAVAYVARPGTARLAAVALFSVLVLLFTLNDFFDGDPLWSRGYSAGRTIGSWLIIASTVAVLAGVLWSAVQLAAGAPVQATWWRRRSVVVVGGIAVFSMIGAVGFVMFGDEDGGPGLEYGDDADIGSFDDERAGGDIDTGPVQDEWQIVPDGEEPGYYIVSIVTTFAMTEGARVEGVGGRLMWPETEIELCDVNIHPLSDGSVRVGLISPTNEGCPGMFPAFLDFGVPETACLFVQIDGVVDERCAPFD